MKTLFILLLTSAFCFAANIERNAELSGLFGELSKDTKELCKYSETYDCIAHSVKFRGGFANQSIKGSLREFYYSSDRYVSSSSVDPADYQTRIYSAVDTLGFGLGETAEMRPVREAFEKTFQQILHVGTFVLYTGQVSNPEINHVYYAFVNSENGETVILEYGVSY